jgi:ubiquinone/menaquinone biosynthesis C-methylase UbiE
MIAFAGSVPENYDRHLREILFEPVARDLGTRVADRGQILEIACGTGILTREIVARCPHATIVATDLNPGMIEVAKQSFDSTRVTWRQADAEKLPFGDGEFDAIACQLGYMFVPDKLRAFCEARRVLRSDGVLTFNVWDSLEENDASRILNDVAQSMFPSDPPRFVEIPFSMHDRGEIERLLRAAGFRDVALADVATTMERASARQFATGMVRGTPLFDALQQRGINHGTTIDAAEAAIQCHRGDLRMRAIVVTATREG